MLQNALAAVQLGLAQPREPHGRAVAERADDASRRTSTMLRISLLLASTRALQAPPRTHRATHLRAAEAELASTRHEFETARFDLMGKLQRADATRRVEFKRRLARNVESHRAFFARVHGAYEELGAFVREVEARCDDDEERAARDAANLGAAAAAYRDALREDAAAAAPSSR